MPNPKSVEAGGSLYPVLVTNQVLMELLSGQTEVLDLAEAATFLRTTEDEVVRMIHDQGLPGRPVGDGWRFLKAAICRWLGQGMAPSTGKEGLLAGAGAFQGDPDLEEIVTEAMRLRGRVTAEAK